MDVRRAGLMRVQGITALTIAFLAAFALIAAAKPWWASPGHWAEYEITALGGVDGYEFKVTAKVHFEVVSATEKNFTVRASITDVKVEANNPEIQRLLEQQLASSFLGIKRTFTTTIPFDAKIESDQPLSFYVSPKSLPPDGHYTTTYQIGMGTVQIDAYYDPKTGWAKELHMVYSGSSGLGLREISIKLLASNIVKTNPVLNLLETPVGTPVGGLPLWVIIAVGGAVAATVGVLFVVKKRRG